MSEWPYPGQLWREPVFIERQGEVKFIYYVVIRVRGNVVELFPIKRFRQYHYHPGWFGLERIA